MRTVVYVRRGGLIRHGGIASLCLRRGLRMFRYLFDDFGSLSIADFELDDRA